MSAASSFPVIRTDVNRMNITFAFVFTACVLFCMIGAHDDEEMKPPDFLDKLNATVRQEFMDIAKNHTLEPEEKKAAILQWGSKHGLEDVARQHEERMDKLRKEVSSNAIS
ncbi:unnamed protein product [Haemonchus placei]|uniref:DUF148 domain-containing protein n=1 Tax=Haemonchus placei TaxID=6290 RepID=A0A0N4XA68_HAEPC|nr:unnamed protein product [Haemonchus placei]